VCHYNLSFRAWDILEAPVIHFVRQGDELALSWPVSATSFVLESTATLGTSAGWLAVTNIPVIVGDRFQVIKRYDKLLNFLSIETCLLRRLTSPLQGNAGRAL
jgi:hypothetical protein